MHRRCHHPSHSSSLKALAVSFKLHGKRYWLCTSELPCSSLSLIPAIIPGSGSLLKDDMLLLLWCFFKTSVMPMSGEQVWLSSSCWITSWSLWPPLLECSTVLVVSIFRESRVLWLLGRIGASSSRNDIYVVRDLKCKMQVISVTEKTGIRCHWHLMAYTVLLQKDLVKFECHQQTHPSPWQHTVDNIL